MTRSKKVHAFILDVYDNPNWTSRINLSVARKNGKSALIAAVVVAHLIGTNAELGIH